MDINTLIIILGFLLTVVINTVLMSFSLFKFALSNERRMTRLETQIDAFMRHVPKRMTDQENTQ